jgi:DNA-binding response OmpR family regulator
MAAEDAQKPIWNSEKRRILIVEPEREFREILQDFMEGQRFHVETAERGDDAIAMVSSFSPDIVLLSRELPLADGTVAPDGLRVLKVIKQDLRENRCPVILFSAEASEKDFDRYRKLKFSADDYVSKPFEDTEILRRIENLVGFDLSEDMGEIKDRIEDALDDPLANIFDADPSELGTSFSAATRKEVTQLLEQMGNDLENFEPSMDEMEEQSGEQEIKGFESSPQAEPEEFDAEELKKLRSEFRTTSRQLDRVQKQLKGERNRAREMKKQWRGRLQKIAARLKESEENESRLREEFEAMREKLADMELEHTIEIERLQSEKTHLEEELAEVKKKAGSFSREELALALKSIISSVENVLDNIDKKEEEEKEEDD